MHCDHDTGLEYNPIPEYYWCPICETILEEDELPEEMREDEDA